MSRVGLGSTDGGWAVSVVLDSVGVDLIGPSGGLATPANHDGFAVVWRFSGDDEVELVELRAAASVPVQLTPRVRATVGADARFPAAAGGAAAQRLSILMTPDLPDTATDEFALLINFYGAGSGRPSIECDNRPGSIFQCGFRVSVGDRVRLVVSAAPVGADVVLTGAGGDIGGLCPGT